MRKLINSFISHFLAVSMLCMLFYIGLLLLCHFIGGREVTQRLLWSLNGTDILILVFGIPFIWTISVNMPLSWAINKLNDGH